MRGLSRALRQGDQKTPAGPVAAKARLQKAYANLLNGNPTSEDAEIVVVDLFTFVGYFSTTPPSATTNELWHAEGQRSVAERILALGAPAEEELVGLAASVKAEILAAQGVNDG